VFGACCGLWQERYRNLNCQVRFSVMAKKEKHSWVRRAWSVIRSRDTSVGSKLATITRNIAFRLDKLKRLRIVLKSSPPRFDGWGMTSKHYLPWEENSTDELGVTFTKVNDLLKEKVRGNKFVLSQFSDSDGKIDKNYCLTKLNALSWRHYFVYWTAIYATRFTRFSQLNLVEAGVCDGLTVSFAMSAVRDELGSDSGFEAHLYDAWAEMRGMYLTPEEKRAENSYSFLSLERTKTNLRDFEGKCNFVQGYIPDVFVVNSGPSEISWLHIDLNSSIPTLKTLEQFFPKLLPGGVVLFDDYGHGGYRETREAADQYCSQASGLLMPLPTGQAAFFKR